MGPGRLQDILKDLPAVDDPRVLVSGATMDDAGVYQINEQQALVQTVDFFTPMVDDPYIFGQVAAANALSDIYAMGAIPLTALNVTAFNSCDLEAEILRRILAGGASKLKEAGCVLLGGHTIEDNEPKFGMAITGVVEPDRVITNTGAVAGDKLVLTKPLGSGILSTAVKGELLKEQALEQLCAVMTALNKEAAAVMREVGVRAATDVTGFGLLGHAWEICQSSAVGMELVTKEIPIMNGVEHFAQMGIIPGGAYTNRKYLAEKVDFGGTAEHLQIIMCDPQTSGGLLMSVVPDKLESLLERMEAQGVPAAVIGTVTAGGVIKVK